MAKTFEKLQVTKLSTDFEKAVKTVEQAIPKPKNGQILVRNLYVGVNASDVNVTAGRYLVNCGPPFDIGLESLGVVEDVGENSEFKIGDFVIFIAKRAYSEYLLATESELFRIKEPKPEYLGITFAGITSAIGLYEVACIRSGENVLITAAAGGTGQIAVQCAKMKGCHVIGTCSTAEKVEYLKSIGCDFVINYKKENVDQVLSKHYPKGVDVVWETIGGDMTAVLFDHLASKGRMVVLGAITGYKTEGFTKIDIPNITEKLIVGSRQILGYLVTDYRSKIREYMQLLIAKYDNGEIKVRIDMRGQTSCGIESVASAVNYMFTGLSCGKVVVQISKLHDHN